MASLLVFEKFNINDIVPVCGAITIDHTGAMPNGSEAETPRHLPL